MKTQYSQNFVVTVSFLTMKVKKEKCHWATYKYLMMGDNIKRDEQENGE